MNKLITALKSPVTWYFAATGTLSLIQRFEPCAPSSWGSYVQSALIGVGVVVSILSHVKQVHEALMTPPPTQPSAGPFAPKG